MRDQSPLPCLYKKNNSHRWHHTRIHILKTSGTQTRDTFFRFYLTPVGKEWALFQEAYILLISCWYRSWISFLFNLKAAVTNPISGDQTSLHSFTAAGISNFSNLHFLPCSASSCRTNSSTVGDEHASSKELTGMPRFSTSSMIFCWCGTTKATQYCLLESP